MNKIKSIKLALCISFTALFTTLLVLKYISQDSYVEMENIIILSYFGANAATKFASRG